MQKKNSLEKTTIAIVCNEPVGPGGFSYEASRDILDQVEAVKRSLVSLGVPSIRIAFTRDLRSFVNTIEEEGIRYAFNLCESVDENPTLTGHPAGVS